MPSSRRYNVGSWFISAVAKAAEVREYNRKNANQKIDFFSLIMIFYGYKSFVHFLHMDRYIKKFYIDK